MTKYQVLIGGELQDGVFDTEEEATEHALYLVGCAELGAEILHMSNPGDYEEDDYDDEYEIVEVED